MLISSSELFSFVLSRVSRGKNKFLSQENLLFSRYLRRMDTSKMVEAFDQYVYESEQTLMALPVQSDVEPRTCKPRCLIDRKTCVSLARVPVGDGINAPLISNRLSVRRRDHIHGIMLARVAQARPYVAAYEMTNANLDHERMKASAAAALDRLAVGFTERSSTPS